MTIPDNKLLADFLILSYVGGRFVLTLKKDLEKEGTNFTGLFVTLLVYSIMGWAIYRLNQ